METSIEEPVAHPASGGSAPEVAPIDPEHDIQAKATTIWLVASAIGVLLALVALKGLFGFAVQGERVRKIEDWPTAELNTLRADEKAVLEPASGKKIEDSIREYLNK